jgi:hypothetical protein
MNTEKPLRTPDYSGKVEIQTNGSQAIEDAVIVSETERRESVPKQDDEEIIENSPESSDLEQQIEEYKQKFTNILSELDESSLDEEGQKKINLGRKAVSLIDNYHETDDKTQDSLIKGQYLKQLIKSVEFFEVKTTGQEKKQEFKSIISGEKIILTDLFANEFEVEVVRWNDEKVFFKSSAGEDFVLPREEFFKLKEQQSAKQEIETVKKEPEKTETEKSGIETYEKARAELLAKKQEYLGNGKKPGDEGYILGKEKEYKQALEDWHFQKANAGTLDKISSFFGFKPEMPPELQALEMEYKKSKSEYAKSLQLAMSERSKLKYKVEEGKVLAVYRNNENDESLKSNKEFNINTDKVKLAFANKFVLGPYRERLAQQKELLNDQKQNVVTDLMAKMSKHKVSIRVGVIALAGLAGAATGGLLTGVGFAGLRAGKMLAGTVAGGLAGGVAHKFMQGSVDEAKSNYEQVNKNVVGNFTVDDLDKLEDQILSAQENIDSKLKQQKWASIGVSVLAGAGVSGVLHSVENAVANDVPTVVSGIGRPNTTGSVEVGFNGSEIDGIAGTDESEITVDDKTVTPTPTPTEVPDNILVANNEISQTHTVVRGDTLWDIMEEKYASELKDLSVAEKNQVLGRLFDKVRADTELRDSIGLKSGDIEYIYPGEKINLSSLKDELNRIVEIEKSEDPSSYVKKAVLSIEVDDQGVTKIPINTVTDGIVKDEFPLQKVVMVEPPPIAPVEETVVSNFSNPPVVLNANNYFNTTIYKDYVIEMFGSEKQFNQVLNKEIVSVDSKAFDIFNSRTSYNNTYEFFKEMPLRDIENLSTRNPSELRQIFSEYNIRYDSYLAWIDKIKEIKTSGINYKPETHLSDLFSRYVVETNANKLLEKQAI